MQAYKPGSVTFHKVLVIYLAFSSQKRSNDLPTPVILLDLDEQPSDRSLFGLSTHKVCLAIPVTRYPVGSYPTISPLPQLDEPAVAVFFLLYCLLFWYSYQNTFPLGSMVLYVARTFLFPWCKHQEQRQTSLHSTKLN